MARIPKVEMEKRQKVLQELLEANPEGLSINEIVVALKDQGVVLPKSEYQAIHIVLKQAKEEKVAVNENGKWRLLPEEVK